MAGIFDLLDQPGTAPAAAPGPISTPPSPPVASPAPSAPSGGIFSLMQPTAGAATADAGIQQPKDDNEQFDQLVNDKALTPKDKQAKALTLVESGKLDPDRQKKAEDYFVQQRTQDTGQRNVLQRAEDVISTTVKNITPSKIVNPVLGAGKSIFDYLSTVTGAKPAAEFIADAVSPDVPLSKAATNLAEAPKKAVAAKVGAVTGLSDMAKLGLDITGNAGIEGSRLLGATDAAAKAEMAKAKLDTGYEKGTEEMGRNLGKLEEFQSGRTVGALVAPLPSIAASEGLLAKGTEALTQAGGKVAGTSLKGVQLASQVSKPAAWIGRKIPGLKTISNIGPAIGEKAGEIGDRLLETPYGESVVTNTVKNAPTEIDTMQQLAKVATKRGAMTDELIDKAKSMGYSTDELAQIEKGSKPMLAQLEGDIAKSQKQLTRSTNLANVGLNGTLTRKAVAGTLRGTETGTSLAGLSAAAANPNQPDQSDAFGMGFGLGFFSGAGRGKLPETLQEGAANREVPHFNYGTPLDAAHSQATTLLKPQEVNVLNNMRRAFKGKAEIYALNEGDYQQVTGGSTAGITIDNVGKPKVYVNIGKNGEYGLGQLNHEAGHVLMALAPKSVVKSLRDQVNGMGDEYITAQQQKYQGLLQKDMEPGQKAPVINKDKIVDEIVAEHLQADLDGRPITDVGLPRTFTKKLSDFVSSVNEKLGGPGKESALGFDTDGGLRRETVKRMGDLYGTPFMPNPLRSEPPPLPKSLSGVDLNPQPAATPTDANMESVREKLYKVEDTATAEDKKTFSTRKITRPKTPSAAEDVLGAALALKDRLRGSGAEMTSGQIDTFVNDYFAKNATDRGRSFFDSLQPGEKQSLTNFMVDNPHGVLDFFSQSPEEAKAEASEPSKAQLEKELAGEGTPVTTIEPNEPESGTEEAPEGTKAPKSEPIEKTTGTNPEALSNQPIGTEEEPETATKIYEAAAAQGYQAPRGGMKPRTNLIEFGKRAGATTTTFEGNFIQPEIEGYVLIHNTPEEVAKIEPIEDALTEGYDKLVSLKYNSENEKGELEPVKDKDGQPVLYKSGPRKGEPKMAYPRETQEKAYLPAAIGLNTTDTPGKLYFRGFSVDKLGSNLEQRFSEAAEKGVQLPYDNIADALNDVAIYNENQRRGYGGAGNELEGQPKPTQEPAGELSIPKRDFLNEIMGLARTETNPLVEVYKNAGLTPSEPTMRNLRVDQLLGSQRTGEISELAPNFQFQKHNYSPKPEGFEKAPQVDSEAFKKWFGDSKVVDENGDPQVVYHGTDKNFNKFNPKKTIGGQLWFTSDKSLIEKGEVGANGKGKIIDAYVSIKNPAGWKEYEQLLIAQIKSQGYDGIILPDGTGKNTYIAFDPKQIKSASKNKGTFDPANPDIRYSPQPEKKSKAELEPSARSIRGLQPAKPDKRQNLQAVKLES